MPETITDVRFKFDGSNNPITFDLQLGTVPRLKPRIEVIKRLGAEKSFSQVLGWTSDRPTMTFVKYFKTYAEAEQYGETFLQKIGYTSEFTTYVDQSFIADILIVDASYVVKTGNFSYLLNGNPNIRYNYMLEMYVQLENNKKKGEAV